MTEPHPDALLADPELDVLFGTYLSIINYGSPAAATLAYAKAADPVGLAQLRATLTALRSTYGDVELTKRMETRFDWLSVEDEAATAFWDELAYAVAHPAEPPKRFWQPPQGFLAQRASSFTNEKTAQRAVRDTSRAHADALRAWAKTRYEYIVIEKYFPETLGTIVHRDGRVEDGHVAVVKLHHEGGGVKVVRFNLGIGRPDDTGALPSQRHPALFQFLAGWLHEDFNDTRRSVYTAGVSLANNSTFETVVSARDDLRALRAAHGDTAELMDLLDQLGNALRANPHVVPDGVDPITHYLDCVAEALDIAVRAQPQLEEIAPYD